MPALRVSPQVQASDFPVQLSEYLAQADALANDARALLDGLDPSTRLDAAKGQLNALKDERFNALQAALRTIAAEDRRAAGTAFNALRVAIQEAVDAFAARQAKGTGGEAFDPTMPARRGWQGTLHPVTLVIDEICEIFRELGFTAFTTTRQAGSFNLASSEPAAAVFGRWMNLVESLRPEARRLATALQVHGNRILIHGDQWNGWLRDTSGADGHLSRSNRTAMAVTLADCVPIFVAHPEGAGRRFPSKAEARDDR